MYASENFEGGRLVYAKVSEREYGVAKDARTSTMVHPALTELEDRVAQVSKLVSELDSRLTPVLRPENEAAGHADKAQAAGSAVAVAIQQANTSLARLAAHV